MSINQVVLTVTTMAQPAPDSEALYDDLGKRYEDFFGHNPGLHRVVRRFLEYLPPDACVLDCGSGTGKPVCHMVAETCRPIHGIDLSKSMIELSRKQVPQGTFELCDMLEYSPPPASFGGVTATFSLFELSRAEITALAGKWFHWIQPRGYLLICVIGAEDCESVRSEMYDADGECASGIDYTFMGHKVSLTLFTKAGWNRLLEGVGFEVVHTETDLFKLPPAAKCDDDDEMHYFVIAKKPEAS